MTKKKDKLDKLDLNFLFENSDNIESINPILALVCVLNKLVNNFESKDIIPKNMAKSYALLSNTNQVQKDIINEIIKKENDNKGQVKKMYYDIINNVIKSIKQNQDIEKSGLINRILHR